MTLEEIQKKRAELVERNEQLAEQLHMLKAEFAYLQAVCKHPGLKLVTDRLGGQDGYCQHCGKYW